MVSSNVKDSVMRNSVHMLDIRNFTLSGGNLLVLPPLGPSYCQLASRQQKDSGRKLSSFEIPWFSGNKLTSAIVIGLISYYFHKLVDYDPPNRKYRLVQTLP
jgi:hypothetical protein